MMTVLAKMGTIAITESVAQVNQAFHLGWLINLSNVCVAGEF